MAWLFKSGEDPCRLSKQKREVRDSYCTLGCLRRERSKNDRNCSCCESLGGENYRPLRRGKSRGFRDAASGCCQFCCMLTVCVTVVGLVHALVVRAMLDVHCVPTTEVTRRLPEASEYLPLFWRGAIWMDQGGAYGHSDLSKGSGFVAVSLGGGQMDLPRRTVQVSCASASWSVENNARGYKKLFSSAVLGYGYFFAFSEDWKSAQIYPTVKPLGGFLGTWYLPQALMKFTMSTLDFDAAHCPPRAGASKSEVSQCANWERRTTFLDLFPDISNGIGAESYSAFEIVDAAGRQHQPAYQAYQRWANGTTHPDAFAAWFLLRMDIAATGCDRPDTTMMVRR